MSPEEIQAIRNKYKYNPSTLNTGVDTGVSNAISLNDFSDIPQETAKQGTSLISKTKSVVGGASEGFGTNLALSAIDYVGKKAVESLPDDFHVAGVTKQQMLSNLEKSPSLNEKFKQDFGGNENPNLYTGSKVASTVASIVPAAVEQIPKVLATPTGQKIVKPIVQAGKDIVEAGKSTIAKRNISKVENLINPTEDLLTPLQRKQAIAEGRQTIKTNKLGGTEVGYVPTAETSRASEILSSTIKPSDKPNVVFAKIKSTIATRGAEAENYLAKNPTKITNAEDANVFSSVKTQAEKNLTESELKAYDEQIKLFQKQLLGRKGGYTTENYYKALKDWEENIAEHLPKGKEAILDPSGIASAKIHAASDIRKAIRDLIGSKHPEFKDKMYDIASLYEAKGNALQIASKTKSKTLLEKYPKTTSAIKNAAVFGGGALGINQLLKD